MRLSDRKALEILGTICVLLAVFAVLAVKILPRDARDSGSVRALTEGWYYLQDGERVPLTLPCSVPVEAGGELEIVYEGLTSADTGKTLSFRGALYRPVVLLDGAEVYRYADAAFPCNAQMRSKLNCVASLSSLKESATLCIRLRDAGAGRIDIPAVYVGDANEILIAHVVDEGINLLLISAMVLIAVIALLFAANMRRFHIVDGRFANVAVFLLLCAAWCALDSALLQEFAGQSPAAYCLSFYAFMTFSIPVIRFVRNTGEMKRFRCLTALEILFYLNALIQSALNLLCGIDFIDMLWATHVLLFVGVALLAALLAREYAKTKNIELRTTLLAFVLLAASGVLALLLYWALHISFYGLIFEFGIVVFILCLLWAVTEATADNLHFRMMAKIYERRSLQDALTGLNNRRGFDQFLCALERDADRYENVALFFMDVNMLKYTNDNFGHGAGDELIIAAANCIRHAFEGAGECYRIGGDEFAAILLNPAPEMRAWQEGLERRIDAYNEDARHPLSIACGYSMLRGEDGRIKRLSDWKYEADQNMYRHKSAQKREMGMKEGVRDEL